jgi:HB1, ASXL, restriction endonuclease HTH domain
MAGSNDFSSIRIGSRVRHSDGVTGRIVWANATTVKVQWDDGEKVNWKRAELADKGLEILDAEQGDESQVVEPEVAGHTPVTETAATTIATTSQVTEPQPEMTAPAPAEAPKAPTSEPSPTEPVAAEPAAKSPKKRTPRQPKPTGEKKPSALDAAAKVLGEEGRPMGCQELIGAMAAKGYWTSPGGKTPASTLYSALLREMDIKGEASRFTKVGKGMFALRTQS